MSIRGKATSPGLCLLGLSAPLRNGILVILASLILIACDGVPNEQNPITGNSNRVLGYTGEPCGTGFNDPDVAADACTFKVEFWNKMTSTQCDNCHDTNSGNQSPFFMESSNVNRAYTEALTIVDLTVPADSSILSKIQGGHNCGDTAACNALSTIVEGYINNWANGGTVAAATNVIELVAPTLKDPGTSKSLPDTSTLFASTVWPLLTANCSGCHAESATFAQSPFFAEADPDAAYEAVKTSQKIDLDNPANSRLVLRLNPELHNCWDPNNSGGTDCVRSAEVMQDKITEFANGIDLSGVDPAWLVSKAMTLGDGILASGGARDDSSTIALYEFKSGTGNTAYDTSGVEPALDLTLFSAQGNSAVEERDFKWVGGYGMQFISGHAQGSAQNSKLRDHIVASGEFSIEGWIVPGDTSQGEAGDPARIISYSGGQSARDFTLGQAEYRYEFMNRTSNSDPNGNGTPSFITDDDDRDLQATLQHVVATFDPINGRKIYVNGVDISTTGANDTDPTLPPGDMLDWENFALILGSEAGGGDQWQGALRLVAIHDRAMTPAQILQNFEAGVGQKFYLLFGVSQHTGVNDSYILFQVSQYDSYSYLFSKPTFISLDPAADPDGLVIKGMRIGLNGNEPAVGQAYAKLDTTISNPGSYDPATGQSLSDIGTIIELKKGPVEDEFFLTFEQLGSNTNVRVPLVCGLNSVCSTTPVDGTPVSDIGMRTFDEINLTMATVTGIDPNDPEVKSTFETIKQQLPTIEDINTFVSAHEIGISQLAIEYCSALVDDSTKRAAYFPGFDFSADANGISNDDWQDLVITPLMNNVMGLNLTTQPDITAVRDELLLLITEPSDTRGIVTSKNPYTVTPDGEPDGLARCSGVTCPAGRTELVVKATCAALLGSAVSLMQ